jgi:hypothetical protein
MAISASPATILTPNAGRNSEDIERLGPQLSNVIRELSVDYSRAKDAQERIQRMKAMVMMQIQSSR